MWKSPEYVYLWVGQLGIIQYLLESWYKTTIHLDQYHIETHVTFPPLLHFQDQYFLRFFQIFLLPQHQSGRWRDFFLGLCRLWFCPLDISRSTLDQDFFRLFLYLKVFGIQNFYSILKYHHFILLMVALGVYFNFSSRSVPMKTLTKKSKNLVGWAFFSFVYWKIWGNS